jgi:hypothetical protein
MEVYISSSKNNSDTIYYGHIYSKYGICLSSYVIFFANFFLNSVATSVVFSLLILIW